MLRELRPALIVFGALTLVTGVVYPARRHARRAARVPEPGDRQRHRARRPGRRLAAARPAVLVAAVFLEPAVGDGADAVQRRRLERLEPGPLEPRAGRGRRGAHRRAAGGRSRQHARRCPSISSPRRAAGSIRTSASPRPSTRSRASLEPATCRRPRSRARPRAHARGAPSACSASRASTCSTLNLALDARRDAMM